MAKNQIRQYTFSPGASGVGFVRIPGRWAQEQILLITNVTRGTIIYSFGDPTAYATAAAFVAGDGGFPNLTQRDLGYTQITLFANTTGQLAGDKLQILTESKDLKIRPFDFGTDAIERIRVSNPQSVIDADFEYGLQPTKWASLGTIRNYPSFYDFPGQELTPTAVTTSWNTLSTTNSLITITFSTTHSLLVNTPIKVDGLLESALNFSAAQGGFIINSVPAANQITYWAKGIVGTSNGQSVYAEPMIFQNGQFYTNASIPVSTVTSNGADPSVLTVTTSSEHGLLPGAPIIGIMTGGTNPGNATGPFVISQVVSPTVFTFTARAGAIVTPGTLTLYVRTDGISVHRPFDGGIQLFTGSPAHGAAISRISKRYFRYQSGKGLLWSTGTLFKPNYDVQNITAAGTAISSVITITTDNIYHGLQVGATISLQGVVTSGYNQTYTVASVVNDYQFTVLALAVLGSATPTLGFDSRVFVTRWTGAVVRGGMFDDQNGNFFECNGDTLFCVIRSATKQVTGTVSININSNAVTGAGTRFTEQLKSGDKIVIRGMTHVVSRVVSNTSLFVTPDYRGTVNAVGVKAALVTERRIPQASWNIDAMDGNGPSGFTLDLNKMQMVGIQYTWYGAGFVDFMIRGGDGNWVMVHRMKNNNVNNEAFMRSGNLPVRYTIENDGPYAFLAAGIGVSDTSLTLNDGQFFPNSGLIYIDNEILRYTSRAGNVLSGVTRAQTLSLYTDGATRNFTAGVAATHAANTGVIFIGVTASPTLNHWGSALIMDGGYDQDRGYIFNYQRLNLSLTTTTQTAFLIRLAPSVSNSLVGNLGQRDLINRSQLLLNAIGIAVANGTSTPGAVIVEGVLNPRNLSSATWTPLNGVSAGGQPSFCQVATAFTWSSGTFALPGEQVFAFAGPSTTAGSVNDRLDLTELKELTNSPIGGVNAYPDGPDVLAVNVRMTTGAGAGHVLLRWSEAQA